MGITGSADEPFHRQIAIPFTVRQDPLRVFVTFTVADGAGVLVQRGVVQVADYLAARRWARQVFSYGLELRGGGWVQYIAPPACKFGNYLGSQALLVNGDRAPQLRAAYSPKMGHPR